jgi:hypothetical protein
LLLSASIVGALVLWPAGALAYTVGPASTASGPAAVAGGVPFTFTAHFVQPDATPEPPGLTVTFSELSGPGTAALPATTLTIAGRRQVITLAAATCQASFNLVTTVDDATGTATSLVTLPLGCPGQFVLAATLSGPGVTGSNVITLTVVETGGFPNTTADRPGAMPWWLIGCLVALALAMLVGASRLWSLGRGRWS